MLRNERRRLIVTCAVIIFGWLGVLAPAAIERALAPVLTHAGHEALSRGETVACWRWRFIKHRPAIQTDAQIDVTVGAGEMVNAAPLISEGGQLRYFRRMASSTPSLKEQSRVVCVDLERARITPRMAARARLRITYIAWPGLWESVYEIPAVEIPRANPEP